MPLLMITVDLGRKANKTSFVDHLCYLCCVFVMLSCLFIAAMWSPAGKGLTSWLLFVMFVFLLLPMWYPGSGVVLDCIDS